MPQEPITSVILYGAGDAGTQELLDHLVAQGVRVQFRDIRKPNSARVCEHLKTLVENKLRTVPQVFQSSGELIGNYYETRAWLHTRGLR